MTMPETPPATSAELWAGYHTVVELPEDDGWVARPFDESWDEELWPRRFLQPMLDAFYRLYPTPPPVGIGYCVVMVDSDLGAFKLDAVPEPEPLVRVMGPLMPDMIAWIRDEHPELYLEMEVTATPVH
jgi:hypothetical protein